MQKVLVLLGAALLVAGCASKPEVRRLASATGPQTALAVTCKSHSRVETLDLNEGRIMNGYAYPAEGTVSAHLNAAITRLQPFDAKLARYLRSRTDKLYEQFNAWESYSKQKDANAGSPTCALGTPPPIVMDGCQLICIVQKTPARVNDTTVDYVVDVSLWRSLSGIEQAALLTHLALEEKFPRTKQHEIRAVATALHSRDSGYFDKSNFPELRRLLK